MVAPPKAKDKTARVFQTNKTHFQVAIVIPESHYDEAEEFLEERNRHLATGDVEDDEEDKDEENESEGDSDVGQNHAANEDHGTYDDYEENPALIADTAPLDASRHSLQGSTKASSSSLFVEVMISILHNLRYINLAF
jgi:hypothetical protein